MERKQHLQVGKGGKQQKNLALGSGMAGLLPPAADEARVQKKTQKDQGCYSEEVDSHLGMKMGVLINTLSERILILYWDSVYAT